MTGGPWYTDQEFDYEFVKHLSNYVLSYVKGQVGCSAETVLSLNRCLVVVRVHHFICGYANREMDVKSA